MFKKNVSRRQFLAGSLATTGALALSACVPAAPTSSEDGGSMETSTEPVTVLFHTRLGTHADWHKSRKDLFEEQNPGILLEIDELPVEKLCDQVEIYIEVPVDKYVAETGDIPEVLREIPRQHSRLRQPVDGRCIVRSVQAR